VAGKISSAFEWKMTKRRLLPLTGKGESQNFERGRLCVEPVRERDKEKGVVNKIELKRRNKE